MTNTTTKADAEQRLIVSTVERLHDTAVINIDGQRYEVIEEGASFYRNGRNVTAVRVRPILSNTTRYAYLASIVKG